MQINITESQRERAKKRFNFGELKNSIRKGEGNQIGAIGEILVMDYYLEKGRNVIDGQNFDFDFMIDGHLIEVKTQETRFKPNDSWTCHVPDYNAKQKCDFYCFVFVNSSMTTGWIAGMIRHNDFHKIKKLKKKGEIGFKHPFKCDTWTILISDLIKI